MSDKVRAALEMFDAQCANLGGCSDGGCVVQRPKGMHTNGGCRCPDDRNKMRRFAGYASYFRYQVEAALRELEKEDD